MQIWAAQMHGWGLSGLIMQSWRAFYQVSGATLVYDAHCMLEQTRALKAV